MQSAADEQAGSARRHVALRGGCVTRVNRRSCALFSGCLVDVEESQAGLPLGSCNVQSRVLCTIRNVTPRNARADSTNAVRAPQAIGATPSSSPADRGTQFGGLRSEAGADAIARDNTVHVLFIEGGGLDHDGRLVPCTLSCPSSAKSTQNETRHDEDRKYLLTGSSSDSSPPSTKGAGYHCLPYFFCRRLNFNSAARPQRRTTPRRSTAPCRPGA